MRNARRESQLESGPREAGESNPSRLHGPTRRRHRSGSMSAHVPQNERACVRSCSWGGRERSFGKEGSETPMLTTLCEDRAALNIELRPWSVMEASRSVKIKLISCAAKGAALPRDRLTRSSEWAGFGAKRIGMEWVDESVTDL